MTFWLMEKYVKERFAEGFHIQQVIRMALFLLGVLYADRLNASTIGTGLAKACGTVPKHGIKQFERFLGNKKVRMADFKTYFATAVVSTRKKILVTMDRTDYDVDDYPVLVLSLVTRSTRALSMIWTVVQKSTFKGTRNQHEKTAVQILREALPIDVHMTIFAGHGFGDIEYFDHLVGFENVDIVICFKENRLITHDGNRAKAAAFAKKNGRMRLFTKARFTGAENGTHTVVLKAGCMKDTLCLDFSFTVNNGEKIWDFYEKRFERGEAFCDISDRRYGLHLSFKSVSNPQRRERFLLVVDITYFLMTLLGVTSERIGIDRIIKASTTQQRTNTLFRPGREVLSGVLTDTFENRLIKAYQHLFSLSKEKGFCRTLS